MSLVAENDLHPRSRASSRNPSRRNSESDATAPLAAPAAAEKVPSRQPSPNPAAGDHDPAALALFQHWQTGKQLAGPRDFHSTQHYLGLYVLAKKAQCEPLQNEVIDLIRSYYRREKMTAPAFRLAYVYAYAPAPDPMRKFLVATAAYRSLCEPPATPGNFMTDSITSELEKRPDLNKDFINALVKIAKSDMEDPRSGSACAWHTHESTEPCVKVPGEAWQ